MLKPCMEISTGVSAYYLCLCAEHPQTGRLWGPVGPLEDYLETVAQQDPELQTSTSVYLSRTLIHLILNKENVFIWDINPLYFFYLCVLIHDCILQRCWPGYLCFCTVMSLQALCRRFSTLKSPDCFRNCAVGSRSHGINLHCDTLMQIHNSAMTKAYTC